MSIASSSRPTAPHAARGDRERVELGDLNPLDLGLSINPGRAWCLARAASLGTSTMPTAVAAVDEPTGNGSPLVQLLRRTLVPKFSDHPSSIASSFGVTDDDLETSTSLTVAGRPTERLTWEGNAAAWTRGVELVRSFVFDSHERVSVAAFASFSLQSAARRSPVGSQTGPLSGPLAAASELSSEQSVLLPQLGPKSLARPKQVRRASQARGPRVSEGASFVRQSAHPSAQADSSAFLQVPAALTSAAPVPNPSSSMVPFNAGESGTSTSRQPTSDPQTPAVCFLFSDALHIYPASGVRQIVWLPCPMEPSLWAIEGGGVAMRSRGDPSDVNLGQGGSLFVVRYPLDGVLFVSPGDENLIVCATTAAAYSGPASSFAAARASRAQTSQTSVGILAEPRTSRSTAFADLDSVVEVDGRQVMVPGLERLDPLTRDCLGALDGVLPSADLSALRVECLRFAGRACASSDAQTPFDCLKSTLLNILAGGRLSSTPALPRLSSWERIASFNRLSKDPALQTLAASPPSSSASTASGPLLPLGATCTAAVVLALHLLAEDYRLDILRFQDLRVLGGLVAQLSSCIGRRDWADHWFRQGCTVPSHTVGIAPTDATCESLLPTPPDIYAHLRAILTSKATTCAAWPVVSSGSTSSPSLAATLIDLYGILSTISPNTAVDCSAVVVNRMVARGLDRERLQRIPFGLALPLMAAIKTCRTAPLASWSPAVFKLIRRPDLVHPSRSMRYKVTNGALEPVATRSLSRPPPPKNEAAKPSALPILALRFGSDRRLEEVERLLSTTRISTFRLRDRAGLSEDEIAAHHRVEAGMLISRTQALPVGQGMFTYATSTAVNTSVFALAPIELTVKTVCESGTQTVQGPFLEPETTTWPDFANGVAQALQIRADSAGIDNSWIVYNKPRDLTATHGGFLLGLGLTGHLRKMIPWHAFSYLDARHEPTSVGILLGLAASHLASCDQRLTKLLALNVHALLPYGSRELHSTPLVQAASMTGIGLLYLGSGNRRMAEVALSEVTRQSSNEDAPVEAQAYAFAAAMAFGKIMLGRGGEATRAGDPLLVSHLRTLIDGRTPAGDVRGPTNGQPTSRAATPDLNVTSAPATLALGLMYLRTGRQDIAAILEIPQSPSDLQFIRPDLLYARTLARGLILWDEIADSEAWIDSNLPAFLRTSLGKRQRDAPSVGMQQTLDLARLNILAGACFALALRFAGTARESVHLILLHHFDAFYARATANASTFQQRIRLNAARSCVCVVALSLAITMAGTGNLSLLYRLRLAHGQHERFGYGIQQAMHMSLGLLFLGKGLATVGNSPTAIAAMVCAFYPAFNIGPGDNASFPQAFRHLWALAVEPRCLIARDIESREPVYLPIKVKTEETGTFGSRVYTSPTLLPPLDSLVSVAIDSPRYWPVVLELRQKPNRSPTVLDHHRPLESILVKRRSGFLSYADDPRGNRSILTKAGLTTGVPDLGSMSVAPVAKEGITSLRQSVAAYTSNPFLLAFVRRLCAPNADMSGPSTNLQQFCESVLLECLVNDQPQLIALYLHIRHVGRRAAAAPHFLPAVQMQNLRLALESASTSSGEAADHLAEDERQATTLLRQSFLRETTEAMTAAFALDGPLRTHFQQYLGDVDFGPQSEAARNELALYLTSAGVPSSTVLATLRDAVLNARAQIGGQQGVSHQVLDGVLRLLVKTTLGCRLQLADQTPAGQEGGSDLGWVGAALDVWR